MLAVKRKRHKLAATSPLEPDKLAEAERLVIRIIHLICLILTGILVITLTAKEVLSHLF